MVFTLRFAAAAEISGITDKFPRFPVEGKEETIVALWARTSVIAFGERTWLSKSEVLLGRIAVLSTDIPSDDLDLLVDIIIGGLTKGVGKAYASVQTKYVNELKAMGFSLARECPSIVEDKCVWNLRRGIVTVPMEKVA